MSEAIQRKLIKEIERSLHFPCSSEKLISPYYLYFVDSDNKYIKIGITKNVKDRMYHYGTMNPTPITLLAELEMPNQPSAKSLEGRLLSKFKKHHVKGEWFERCEEIVQYASEAKRINESLVEAHKREALSRIESKIRKKQFSIANSDEGAKRVAERISETVNRCWEGMNSERL